MHPGKKGKKVRTKIRFSISLKGTALPRKKKKKMCLAKKKNSSRVGEWEGGVVGRKRDRKNMEGGGLEWAEGGEGWSTRTKKAAGDLH
jgi:hypothetical protein